MNLAEYLPIALFMLFGIAVGAVSLTLGFALGQRRPYAEKNSAYECGFEAFEDARMKFDVRYYLIAILFILFDLETAFLIPAAVSLRDTGMAGLIAITVFVLELVVGYIYIWKKGALEWE